VATGCEHVVKTNFRQVLRSTLGGSGDYQINGNNFISNSNPIEEHPLVTHSQN